MGESLPESSSNLFLVFGEPAPVPVMPCRQAGKSQQPRLAVWMLIGGELTAQESVLGTADMFKWRGRSQTKMLVFKVWKSHRVTPAPCGSPAGEQGHIAWRGRGCLHGEDQGQERRRRRVLPHLPAREEQGGPSLDGCPWPRAFWRALALGQQCRNLASSCPSAG